MGTLILRSTLACFVTCTFVVLGFGVVSADAPRDPWVLLLSEDPREREAGARSILAQHGEAVHRLQDVARELMKDPSRAGAARDAVHLLGKMRSREAIPFLVENLTYLAYTKGDGKRAPTMFDARPCSGALAEIGFPSLDPLMARVESATVEIELEVRVAAHVIRHVIGGPLGIEYLRLRSQATSVATSRERMEAVRKHIAILEDAR